MKKHVVVGIITKIENKTNKYLLITSKKNFGKFSGFYYPPGGHVKTNENKISALKREIKEEVGLDIYNIIKVTTSKGDIPNQITHWYKCSVESYKVSLNKNEICKAKYFSKHEILKINIWPSTLKVLQKYIFK